MSADASAASSSRPSGASASTRGASAFPDAARRLGPGAHGQAAAGLRGRAARRSRPARHRDARRGQEGDAGAQAVRADDDRRRRRPRRVDQDRVRGRRRLLGRRTPVATSPSASASTAMGSIVNGARAARRHRQAVRLDLPRLLRLHAARRAPVRADARCRSSGCGRTTRSGSARTARRTSRSSTTRRCARSRISGSSVRPTPTRPPYAWKVALDREDGPVALSLDQAEGADARPLRARRGVGRRARRLRALGRRATRT